MPWPTTASQLTALVQGQKNGCSLFVCLARLNRLCVKRCPELQVPSCCAGPSQKWWLGPPPFLQGKHVSRISLWRYVRALFCNNNYSGCDCARIGAFARDDCLAQA